MRINIDLVRESEEFLRLIEMNKEEIKLKARTVPVSPEVQARCQNNFVRVLKEYGYNYQDNLNICLLVNGLSSSKDFNYNREVIYLPNEDHIQQLLSRFKSTYPSWLM